ncbi:DUF883 domain-containing protein [Aestuariibacter sp. AA17]|uniref:DUF883 domain-containing protein n=1 Tax=Fluctibacter corallii TaxID=2984329 RepID=A0ABT3A919_9ALTE|nr:DUF883 domain-containing protein [Aestuariibacter sp. AA17]MCV2885180.1 DUF883 domain-containing protein [Aestuariibacter sp. AA17]
MATASPQSKSQPNGTGNTHVSTGAPLTDKARDTLHEAIDNLAARVSATEVSLREGAHNSAESFSKKRDEIDKKWHSSSVGKYVSDHPVASAGIAFAAGVLISSLLRKPN